MKYIIMCGGDYKLFDKPKQLLEINGEPIIARTIRLLKECGVDDIAISSNNPEFDRFGVPVLHHENVWEVRGIENVTGTWVNAFYPMDEPVCYLMGDVVFSPEAIKKIVNTSTDSVEFFASAPPFSKQYYKPYAEPFGFKVVDTKYFRFCVDRVKTLEAEGKFRRHPIAWELWSVIKTTPINEINYSNYTVINDYTCDVDKVSDIDLFNGVV